MSEEPSRIENEGVRHIALRGEGEDTREVLDKPNPLVGKIVSKITDRPEVFGIGNVPTVIGTGSIV